MKITHAAFVAVMALTLIAMSGCCDGVKVTFVNGTASPIVVGYHSAGMVQDGEYEAQTTMDLAPGKSEKKCLEYSEGALETERQLGVTVDGGTMKSATALIPIARAPYTPKKLAITVTDAPDVGHVITVIDGEGKPVKTK